MNRPALYTLLAAGALFGAFALAFPRVPSLGDSAVVGDRIRVPASSVSGVASSSPGLVVTILVTSATPGTLEGPIVALGTREVPADSFDAARVPRSSVLEVLKPGSEKPPVPVPVPVPVKRPFEDLPVGTVVELKEKRPEDSSDRWEITKSYAPDPSAILTQFREQWSYDARQGSEKRGFFEMNIRGVYSRPKSL